MSVCRIVTFGNSCKPSNLTTTMDQIRDQHNRIIKYIFSIFKYNRVYHHSSEIVVI